MLFTDDIQAKARLGSGQLIYAKSLPISTQKSPSISTFSHLPRFEFLILPVPVLGCRIFFDIKLCFWSTLYLISDIIPTTTELHSMGTSRGLFETNDS